MSLPEADPLLSTREGVERVQSLLRKRGLDGWLLFEFHGNNPVAADLLGLEWTTRRSFALVPARGDPVALVHAIEGSSWRRWPWPRRTYGGWRELEEALAELLRGRPRVAMETSPRSAVPTLDLVPAGVLELVREAGAEPVSSGDLVTAFHSVWSARQLDGHRRTAEALAGVARRAHRRAADGVRAGETLTEGALAGWILEEMEKSGVGVDRDCIVAVGSRASDPHYQPEPGSGGAPLADDELLLVDLWGRPSEGDVHADQTWMGFLGGELPGEVQEIWECVRDARDAAVAFLRKRAEDGREVRGFEVDDVCRKVVSRRGYGEYFIHRTGHSIDLSLHGSGPNLDHLETRDERLLLPGVGFSVEPGVYIPGRLGIRSEINVHWGEEGPEVTPSAPQDEVLVL